jgi:FAD/FMN-containing dehydrogenase
MSDSLLAALTAAVGPAHVLSDPELRAGYERDWTGRWRGDALAVVRPADTAQVSAVLTACAAHDAVIVPQGGNTGLVGGGVPRPGGRQVVLSSARLNRVGEVARASAQLSAGAGVTLATAQRAARDAGLELGLDLAARDSATLGGLAACDAGGLRALRHGTARRQVAGLEAVLADGSVIRRMSGLLKDNAGYDLTGLLVGSEGTLGVITAVRWSLIARRDARAVALVALDSIAEAVTLMRTLRPALPSLEVCELMGRTGIRLTLAHLGEASPLPDCAAAVLLECAATSDPLDELATALDAAGAGERAVVAADASGRERLLRLREAHTDAVAAAGVPHKLDVGIPLERLAEFADRLDGVVADAAPGSRLVVWGHLGDGNLHVNVLGPAPGEDAVDARVLELAVACGGTVSAEHGIGVHKVAALRLSRSAAELHAMRAVKRALDPTGILNPGVGLDPRDGVTDVIPATGGCDIS